ncbi:hypothetical protein BH09SUM1_BH09SUM1_03030 [soil metagenome]
MIPDDRRPARLELFAFYYLGFSPEAEYKFPNAHHIARYYKVSSDAVLRWLEELDLDPHKILLRHFNLAAEAVDLQLEAETLTPAQIFMRADAILKELDVARGGRKPWEDVPF